MKSFYGFLIFSVLIALASPAQACYTSKEVEAEQGVRIHSELMVIGLTCLKMPKGVETYTKYKQFTEKNSGLISGYEADLINYYIKNGINSPEKKLHSLRTDIANKISQHAVKMSMLSFCQQFTSRVDTALSMDEQGVRQWARYAATAQVTSEPVCRAKI